MAADRGAAPTDRSTEPQAEEPVGMVYGFGPETESGWPELHDVWTAPAGPIRNENCLGLDMTSNGSKQP